jgi:hypothetical protein
LCQHAIVEEGTLRVSLINCFRRLRVKELPTRLNPFTVAISLTDGQGLIPLSLEISRLDTWETVFERTWQVSMRDPLKEFWLIARISKCVVPVVGRYVFEFSVNGDLIANSVMEVYTSEVET